MSEETYQKELAKIMRNPEAAGLEAAIRLKNIEIARLKLELARERYNHAGLQIDHWEAKLKRAEEISRGTIEAPTI